MGVGHSGWSRGARGRAVRRRPPDADRKCFEVLHDCSEVELVAGAGETPQPHPFEAMVGLEVSKPHLDLLALVARSVELGGAHRRMLSLRQRQTSPATDSLLFKVLPRITSASQT